MNDFDIIEFLKAYNIPYQLEGKNVSRGWVGIPCPFCGDDPSNHLGINLENGAWNCWRNPEHKGRKLHPLIMKIAGVSKREAAKILGEGSANLDELGKIIYLMENEKPKKINKDIPASLEMPTSFKRISEEGMGKPYFEYIVSRGFKRRDVSKLVRRYDLHYSVVGNWQYYVIVPIYMKGTLVSWTARSISSSPKLRYKTLSHKPESAEERGDPIALMPIKNTLYNYDRIKRGGNRLLIAEGPFDALKLDFYGRENGIKATCLYNLLLSENQEHLLSKLKDKFNEFCIILDSEAEFISLRLASRLSVLNPKIIYLPENIKDPAELDAESIRYL